MKCCKKLNVTLYATAKENQGKMSGIYDIASKIMGNYNYWKRGDNLGVIWFEETKNRWTISSSYGVKGHIIAPFSYLCPSQIGKQWQYFDKFESLINAEADIKIDCIG